MVGEFWIIRLFRFLRILRQVDGEYGALRLVVGNFNGSAVHVDIFVYDVQTYAAACFRIIITHLIEALEDVFLVGICHTAAGVGN